MPCRSRNADTLVLPSQIHHCRLARPREFTHRLVTTVWHPHRRELAGTHKLRQADGISPIGLHTISGLLRDQRWSSHNALVPAARDLPVLYTPYPVGPAS
jgi:hypothetical protein